VLERAIEVGKAVITHVVAGCPEVDEATYDRRIGVCKACEFLTEAMACRKCTCHMEIKARWADQKCPMGKWGGE
jgi:hypothetical protein